MLLKKSILTFYVNILNAFVKYERKIFNVIGLGTFYERSRYYSRTTTKLNIFQFTFK